MGFINKNLQQLFEEPFAAGRNDAIDMHVHVHDGVTIMHYHNAVPPFAEIWLERLYGNIFSSFSHYRICDGTAGIHTYIASRDDAVLAVLLYRTEGAHVRILNEGTRLPAEEIERFARHVFHTYPAVNAVSLHAVCLDGTSSAFPVQRFNCLEDIVLRLPACADEYTAHLGKSTRAYLNRYQNKLRRDFASMQHVSYSRGEIQEHHVREILDLNRSRMKGKGKVTPWTEKDERRILELARACGMVHVIVINGRICAGTINYRAGDNYFLEIVAHAPECDDYRLGTLCCFATICQCIAMGAKEYHFLWGQSPYKFRLGGVQQDLEHVSIFRSRGHMLRNPSLVLQNCYEGVNRMMRLRVQEMQRRESALVKPLDGLRSFFDRLKFLYGRGKQRLLNCPPICAEDPAGSTSPGLKR